MPAKPLEYLKKNEDGNYNYLFFFSSLLLLNCLLEVLRGLGPVRGLGSCDPPLLFCMLCSGVKFEKCRESEYFWKKIIMNKK